MAIASAVATALLASGSFSKEPCDAAPTTILVVRHADRASPADSLTASGVARSQDLARVALTAGVSAIYHSDTRRTRDTAVPLGTALGIRPEEYPAKEVAALIERIRRDHPGKTVLVVGHSNTVPMIVAAAGGPVIPDIKDDEFDGLFIVHMTCPDRGSTLTQLQYGVPSP